MNQENKWIRFLLIGWYLSEKYGVCVFLCCFFLFILFASHSVLHECVWILHPTTDATNANHPLFVLCFHPSIHHDDYTSQFGNDFARALFKFQWRCNSSSILERDASVRDKRTRQKKTNTTSVVLHGMIIFKMKIVILMLLLLICLPKGLQNCNWSILKSLFSLVWCYGLCRKLFNIQRISANDLFVKFFVFLEKSEKKNLFCRIYYFFMLWVQFQLKDRVVSFWTKGREKKRMRHKRARAR